MMLNEEGGGNDSSAQEVVHQGELPNLPPECITKGSETASFSVTTPARPVIATMHAMVRRDAGFVCEWCGELHLPSVGSALNGAHPLGPFYVFQVPTAMNGEEGVAVWSKRPLKTNFVVPCGSPSPGCGGFSPENGGKFDAEATIRFVRSIS